MRKKVTLSFLFGFLLVMSVHAQPVMGTTTFGNQTTFGILATGNSTVSATAAGWTITLVNQTLSGSPSATISMSIINSADTMFNLSTPTNHTLQYISLKSSDGSEFKLNSFRFGAVTQSNSYKVLGYKDGVLVPSASSTVSLSALSSQTTATYNLITVSGISAFRNIDEFRLVPTGTVSGAVVHRLDDIDISPVAVVWTGNSSNAWSLAANWNTGNVPTDADSVVIANTTTAPTIGTGTSAVADNVTIQQGAVLTVNGTGTLTVGNGLLVKAGGSLVGNSSNVTAQVTIQQSFVGQRGWRMLSNPFSSDQAIATLASTNGITLNTTAQVSGLTDIRTFSNASNTWSNITGTGSSIAANTAYGLFYRGLASEVSGLTYSGGPSATTYSVSGTLNGATTTITPNSTSNFLLVGNPYAAPVTTSSLTNGTGVSYYVYNITQGGNQTLQRTKAGSWSAVLSSSATTTIPVMGVLAYKPSSTSSYNISSASAINTTGTAQSNLFRTQEAIQYLELQVEQNGLLQDKLFLRVDDKATKNGTDRNDLEKFWNDNLNLYTRSFDGKYLGIDAREMMDSIPLGISALAGDYVFRVASNSLPLNYTTYLIDNFLNTKTVLKQNSTYSFNISNDPASKGEKRFALNFSKGAPLNTVQAFDVKVLGNIIREQTLMLNIAGSDTPVSLTVTDMLGRKVCSANNLPNGTNAINLGNIQAGMYLLQVSNGKTMLVEKIVKQ